MVMILMMMIMLMMMTTWSIEPAEAEPPPAHSIGMVGEDVMGRPRQFVKPCWLAAGGMALVVRSWWQGWRSGLFFRCFLIFLVTLAMKNHPKSRKAPKRRKNSKNTKKTTKKWDASFQFWDPKSTKI